MGKSDENEGGALRGLLIIVVTGVVLGVGYNYLGLEAGTWGVSWIAEDRTDLPTLDLAGHGGGDGTRAEHTAAVVEPGEGFPVADSDDPMAIPGGAAPALDGLPEIPDLGRPIQVQLPVVKQFFDAGAALIIDAREPEEFEAGHIAGALNLPYDEVITDPARLEAVDSGGRPIIAYCGGGSCEVSINLGWELIRLGHPKVLVFMGGYPAWTEAGYPVGSGAADGRHGG